MTEQSNAQRLILACVVVAWISFTIAAAATVFIVIKSGRVPVTQYWILPSNLLTSVLLTIVYRKNYRRG